MRELYPSESKFARRGVKDYNGRNPLGEPTDALPGSEEKIRVLVERARQGQALFHPEDAVSSKPTETAIMTHPFYGAVK